MTNYGQHWDTQRMNSKSRIAWGTQYLSPSTAQQILSALYFTPLPLPDAKPAGHPARQIADTSACGDVFEKCLATIRTAKRARGAQVAKLRRQRARNTLVGAAFTSAVDTADAAYEAAKTEAWYAYYTATGRTDKAEALRAQATLSANSIGADLPSTSVQTGADVLGEAFSPAVPPLGGGMPRNTPSAAVCRPPDVQE